MNAATARNARLTSVAMSGRLSGRCSAHDDEHRPTGAKLCGSRVELGWDSPCFQGSLSHPCGCQSQLVWRSS